MILVVTHNLLRMLSLNACPALTELTMVGTVDRSFFQFTEQFLVHGNFSNLSRISMLISLRTASQACLPVMRECGTELRRLEDSALRLPALRELRFVFEVESQRPTDTAKEIRDESTSDLIREMLPELVARHMVEFGRS